MKIFFNWLKTLIHQEIKGAKKETATRECQEERKRESFKQVCYHEMLFSLSVIEVVTLKYKYVPRLISKRKNSFFYKIHVIYMLLYNIYCFSLSEFTQVGNVLDLTECEV